MNMNHSQQNRLNALLHTKAQGFSLIELMIALVLSIIIIGGAISVFIASKRSVTEVEQVSALSENGRFAVQLLTYSVRHISFMGGTHPADIRRDASLGAVATCTGGADAYDTTQSFFAIVATGGTDLGCITDALAGTDILVLKGVMPQPIHDADPDDPNAPRDGVFSFPAGGLAANEVYVVANNEGGVILDGADTPPDVSIGEEFAFGAAWPYRMEIYYISDGAARNGGTPTLSRKVLRWGGAAMVIDTEDLVQGAENMQFLFSYDSDADGDADTEGDSVAVQAAGRWDEVTSMQAFILLRSEDADTLYDNQKTYNLGDVPVTVADNRRRILMSSNIVMRNPRLFLRGGS